MNQTANKEQTFCITCPSCQGHDVHMQYSLFDEIELVCENLDCQYKENSTLKDQKPFTITCPECEGNNVHVFHSRYDEIVIKCENKECGCTEGGYY